MDRLARKRRMPQPYDLAAGDADLLKEQKTKFRDMFKARSRELHPLKQLAHFFVWFPTVIAMLKAHDAAYSSHYVNVALGRLTETMEPSDGDDDPWHAAEVTGNAKKL